MEVRIRSVYGGVAQEMGRLEKVAAFVEVRLKLKSVETLDLMIEVELHWNYQADFPGAGRGFRKGLVPERGPALDAGKYFGRSGNADMAVGPAAQKDFPYAIALEIIVHPVVCRAAEKLYA